MVLFIPILWMRTLRFRGQVAQVMGLSDTKRIQTRVSPKSKPGLLTNQSVSLTELWHARALGTLSLAWLPLMSLIQSAHSADRPRPDAS